MDYPQAIRKHDGRVVAFDLEKLAASVVRAAAAPSAKMKPDEARRLGQQIAEAAGSFLAKTGARVPLTADIRATTLKSLRDIRAEAVAEAYAEHARAASGLLWRVRVVDPGSAHATPTGFPWDRRRLVESLEAAGIARDPAGEVARELERRISALGQEHVSPALIHALAAALLAQRGLDVRPYNARRVAFSATPQARRYDPKNAAASPLPADGPALEAFWLQTVHTPEIVRVVRDNLLSLYPYPRSPEDDRQSRATGGGVPGVLNLMDPETEHFSSLLAESLSNPAAGLWVRADSPERIHALDQALSVQRSALPPLNVLLKTSLGPRPDPSLAALPVTLNAGGLVAREALRDLDRVTVRLAQLVALAAQAHREREEYFNLSPVRGRLLPICVAGLWNAAARLQGESFDAPKPVHAHRGVAITLLSVIRGAVHTLRTETGLALALCGDAPPAAARRLWRMDLDFFLHDGVTLDPAWAYEQGLDLHLSPQLDDLGERLEFAAAAGEEYDEPWAVSVEVPLGVETEPSFWRELFTLFAQSGVARLDLLPGGSARTTKALLRMVRNHLEGFPLLEQMRPITN